MGDVLDIIASFNSLASRSEYPSGNVYREVVLDTCSCVTLQESFGKRVNIRKSILSGNGHCSWKRDRQRPFAASKQLVFRGTFTHRGHSGNIGRFRPYRYSLTEKFETVASMCTGNNTTSNLDVKRVIETVGLQERR